VFRDSIFLVTLSCSLRCSLIYTSKMSQSSRSIFTHAMSLTLSRYFCSLCIRNVHCRVHISPHDSAKLTTSQWASRIYGYTRIVQTVSPHRQSQEHFLLLKTRREALVPLQRPESGVDVPPYPIRRLRTSGAVPPFPIFTCMPCTPLP
jgi:hypothetical protein